MEIIKKKLLEDGKTTVYYEDDGIAKAVTLDIGEANGRKDIDKDIIKAIEKMQIKEKLTDSKLPSIEMWKRINAIPEDDFKGAIAEIKSILLEIAD